MISMSSEQSDAVKIENYTYISLNTHVRNLLKSPSSSLLSHSQSLEVLLLPELSVSSDALASMGMRTSDDGITSLTGCQEWITSSGTALRRAEAKDKQVIEIKKCGTN